MELVVHELPELLYKYMVIPVDFAGLLGKSKAESPKKFKLL